MLIKRQAADTLLRYAAQFPVVGITGPRQSGKTTLAKMVFPDKPYVSFDDTRFRELAASAPADFLLAFPEGVIIDEAQKVPNIFDAIKLVVDKEPEHAGKYILTGSSQFILHKNMSDSLAGRAVFLKLLPFSIGELHQGQIRLDNPYEMAFNGFYPPLYDQRRSFIPTDWFEAYIDMYLDLDVRDQINPSNIASFRKLIQLCATVSGQLLSMNSMAKHLGVSVPTVKSWLSILETSYIIHFLQPDSTNLGKTLVKTPKLYFVDPGLLCHFLRLESKEELILSPFKRNVIETFAVSELLKSRMNQGKKANLTFYRDKNQLEVDIIGEWKHSFAIEIKSDSETEKKLSHAVRKYLALRTDVPVTGAVFYLGSIAGEFNGINYVPWKQWGNFISY